MNVYAAVDVIQVRVYSPQSFSHVCVYLYAVDVNKVRICFPFVCPFSSPINPF